MNRKSLLVAALSASLVAPSFLVSDALSTNRISGSDRYKTSVEISKASYSQSKTIILASGEGFADALAGGQLSIAADAPILLTKAKILDSSVIAEIQRLGAEEVIILGGEKTISNAVKDSVKANSPKVTTVTRIGGKNRYETAKKIMEQAQSLGSFQEVVVVSGKNYPDALASSGYLKSHKALLYLSDGKDLPKTDLKIVAVGGTKSLPLDGFSGKRIAGSNRYETALSIAKESYASASEVVLASGESYADALPAVSISNKKNGPILLTSKGNLSDNVLDYMKNAKVTIVGGINSINTDVENQIKNFVVTADGFVFDSKRQEITGYKGTSKDIVIPSHINGVKVKLIGEMAFQSKGLTSVVFSNTIEEIGDGAFEGNKLTSLEIPSSVTAIYSGAFFNNKISTLKLNEGLQYINNASFKNNLLENVVIPKSIRFIEERAFHEQLCEGGLKYIKIPKGNVIESLDYLGDAIVERY